jgi:hypothetical protein
VHEGPARRAQSWLRPALIRTPRQPRPRWVVPVVVAAVVLAALGGTTYALRSACGISHPDTGGLVIRDGIPATTVLSTATSGGIAIEDLSADPLCDVGPAPWREAAVDADDRTLTVLRLGAACERVAAVSVSTTPDTVTVTLSTGEPARIHLGLIPTRSCGDDEREGFTATVVELPEPVAGRMVVDGSAQPAP